VSKRRLVITAVTVQGLSQRQAAAVYGVSQGWVSRVLARWRVEGEAAFEPRSRRPRSSPSAMSQQVVDLVLRLRKELAGQGLDAGAHTICWHAEHHHRVRVSAATVWRILSRHGQVVPEPAKRPKASYTRFAAELPNQMWQTDFTHWQLTDQHGRRTEVEILNFLDDHSRYLLACVAYLRVSGSAVVQTFRHAVDLHGIPASVLSDNGMVFTTRFAGNRAGRGGRNAFQHELARLGVIQKNSSPAHPQTCGKVERFHQTLKRWLARQPAAATLAELQTQLNAFAEHYNTARPHRALGRATPAVAYQTRPKATPTGTVPTHDRLRRDIIDATGKVTLRHGGRLYKIGVGRTHARTHILLLIQDLHITVINEATGELLRQLDLDPAKTYQPTGRPPGPQHTRSEPKRGFGPMPMS
jgi:transposase InsO family protein